MRNVMFTLFILMCLFSSSHLVAQDANLYTPLNIQWAYENGTRNLDGTPGPNYWINKSEYDIDVEVIPEKKLVIGSENIVYTNNSPDSLDMLVIRLYQDFFRKQNSRDWQVNEESLNDGVFLTKLSVNGKDIDYIQPNDYFTRYGTNIFITLQNKIPPGGNTEVKVGWRFEIPAQFPLRMGAYSDTAFMVAYWYPQIAVYDDISRWDTFNYEGTTEFYNDFSDYTVNITVPHEYIVWGTGVLQNPSKVLTKKFLDRYNKAYTSDEIINIVTVDDTDSGNITADNEKNTWTFKANHVPDFAFATAKGYLWDGTSLVVNKETGRRVFVASAYNRASKDFYEVASIARQTIDQLSFDFPGIPFPYPELTVFNGRGGMEYPMMVNDGSAEDRAGTVHVTSHEITHSYFPFYMGTNERKYAWMDEGWAVMLPFDLQNKIEPEYDPRLRNCQQYSNYSGLELEVPPMVSSTLLTAYSYRTAAYNRPAAAYEFLRDYLGKDLFKKAIKEYVKRWNGKHPIPLDFFNTFNDVTGEDLSWYWKPWFYEFGYPDLAIKNVVDGDEELKVIIEKKGNIPIPVEVKVTYKDGVTDSVHVNAGVWKNCIKETTVKFKTGKKPLSIELGNLRIPDVSGKDNSYYGDLQ